MTDRRALQGVLGGAVALGLVWWSPSLSGSTQAPNPPAPRFGAADVRTTLLDAIPDGTQVASVSGHLTASGDIVGTVISTTGKYYRVRVSGADGHVDVDEAVVTMTVEERPVHHSEWQRQQREASHSPAR